MDLGEGSGKSYPRIVGSRNPGAATQLCVILDLDSCILHTMPEGTNALRDRILTDPKLMEVRSRLYQFDLYDTGGLTGQGDKESYWGLFRPHLQEFMLFLFSHCATVCFWSAAQRPYVDECVARICRTRQPYIIMNHDDVTYLPNGNYHKPLSKIIALDPVNIRFDNCIFIDDRRENFITAMKNGVVIPEYSPAATPSAVQIDDIALLQIRQWMLSEPMLKARDVRDVDKSRIFTTPLRKLPPTPAFTGPLSHQPFTIKRIAVTPVKDEVLNDNMLIEVQI